jgi:hypothetical protein
LRRIWADLPRAEIDAALAHAFGCQVTEPRHPEQVGSRGAAGTATLARRLSGTGTLRIEHDPASRFAYARDGDRAVLFVDGEAHRTSAALARGVCHARLRVRDLRDDHDRAVLSALVAQGSIGVR